MLPDESLDTEGLDRLIEHVIAGGVAAIFVLGTTGEFVALSAATKEHLVRLTCEQVAGRVPVIAGISEPGTQRTIEQARRLTHFGVDAVAVTAPYYFDHVSEELIDHFTLVANAVDVPTIVYNIPGTVKTVLSPDLVARLADIPNIVGLKDSAGELARFQEFLELRAHSPGFRVWQGAEAVAAISLVRGADGAILGLANIAPGLCRELYQAAHSGNLTLAWELQARLLRLFAIQRHRSFVAGLKAAAAQLDLCAPTVTRPFKPLDDEQTAKVRQTLIELELLFAPHSR